MGDGACGGGTHAAFHSCCQSQVRDPRDWDLRGPLMPRQGKGGWMQLRWRECVSLPMWEPVATPGR